MMVAGNDSDQYFGWRVPTAPVQGLTQKSFALRLRVKNLGRSVKSTALPEKTGTGFGNSVKIPRSANGDGGGGFQSAFSPYGYPSTSQLDSFGIGTLLKLTMDKLDSFYDLVKCGTSIEDFLHCHAALFPFIHSQGLTPANLQ
jgi:hypothetical protein